MLKQSHLYVYPLGYKRRNFRDQWKSVSKKLRGQINIPLPRKKQPQINLIQREASVMPLHLEGLIEMGQKDNIKISFYSKKKEDWEGKKKQKVNMHSGEIETIRVARDNSWKTMGAKQEYKNGIKVYGKKIPEKLEKYKKVIVISCFSNIFLFRANHSQL